MTLRFVLSTVVEVLGLLAVTLGVYMLSVPAGIIVAGLVLVLVGFTIDTPVTRSKANQ